MEAKIAPARGGHYVKEWVRRALTSASEGLDRFGSMEADSWLLRNWCEIVAILLATANEPSIHDVYLHIVKHYPSKVNARFALRLENLMALAGLNLPSRKATQCLSAQIEITDDTPRVATALCRFADRLYTHSSSLSPPVRIGVDAPPALFAEAAALHKLPPPSINTVSCDAVAPYLWRRWFRFPTTTDGYASFLLCPTENSSWQQAIVWTGTHDATHLLHLDSMPTGLTPAPIEFNEGLVLAESVAMTVELLTASIARKRQSACLIVLWRGLAERLARVPGIVEALRSAQPASPTATLVCNNRDEEFLGLATLASAYSIGPLRLARKDFEHPLIPPQLKSVLSSAWTERIQADPAFAELTEEFYP